MANGVITWNGVASDTLGIVVSKVPSLNRPQRKYNSYSVPGRNGDIVVMQDAYAEYEQEYEIFALDGAQVDARTIVDWLYQDGWCKLSDDWEPGYYRMAYFVGPLDIEPIISEAAVCTITFRCRPQRFIVQDDVSVVSGDTLTNPTNHTALPLITLTGSGGGPRSLLDMIGKSMSTSSQVIGSREMYTLINRAKDDLVTWIKAPETDQFGRLTTLMYFTGSGGTSGTLSSVNNSTGTISFTPASSEWGIGIISEVSPNSDYTLSFTNSSGAGTVAIWFGSQSGYNNVLSVVVQDVSSGASSSITFKTPTECGYILIGFFKESASAGSFSSIMLANGTTAQSFRPYVENSLESISIGDITLQFSVSTFSTAVIDCENENLTIDGVDSNNASYVIDQYGNVSAEYLRLPEGSSVVTLSSGIASASITLRTWEL